MWWETHKWGCPKSSICRWIFHEINHPAIGVPPFMDTMEILQKTWEGRKPINHGMLTTVFNWCRISSSIHQYVYIPCRASWRRREHRLLPQRPLPWERWPDDLISMQPPMNKYQVASLKKKVTSWDKKKLFHSYSYSHYIHYVPIISPVVSPLGHQFPKQFPAASSVFPVPGGPASSPPRGTRAPAIETCFGGELKCWMRVKFRISMSLQDPPCLFR